MFFSVTFLYDDHFYRNFNAAAGSQYSFWSIPLHCVLSKFDKIMVKSDADWKPNWACLAVGNPTNQHCASAKAETKPRLPLSINLWINDVLALAASSLISKSWLWDRLILSRTLRTWIQPDKPANPAESPDGFTSRDGARHHWSLHAGPHTREPRWAVVVPPEIALINYLAMSQLLWLWSHCLAWPNNSFTYCI